MLQTTGDFEALAEKECILLKHVVQVSTANHPFRLFITEHACNLRWLSICLQRHGKYYPDRSAAACKV